MRYVIYGSGAVGGVIGARLHLAGSTTTLIARGRHLARIRRDGLVLDSPERQHVVRPDTADGAAGVLWSEDTVVLLCVKGHQTLAALADLALHAPPATTVVCAQNGVANEIEALRRFAHTYGLCVMLPSLHLEPGTVVEKCGPVPGILDLGRFPTGVDERAETVASDLRAAGFESQARPDIMAWKYRKLLVNTAGDVRAILGGGDDALALSERVRAEGEAVLLAAGIAVVSAEQDDVRRGDLLRARPDIDSYPGNSLRQSLTRGLTSEIDYRAGEVVLLGRLHAVPTPANEQLRERVAELEKAQRPTGPG